MLSICELSISSTTSQSPAIRQKTPTARKATPPWSPWGLSTISPRVNGQALLPAMLDNHYSGIGANTDGTGDWSF